MVEFIKACRSGDITFLTFLLENNYVKHKNRFDVHSVEILKIVKFLNFEVSAGYDGLRSASSLLNGYNEHKKADNLTLIMGEKIINSGLVIACQIGNLDVAELMVQYGARCFNNGLFFACLEGHLELVKYMISLGADNLSGALQIACRKGYFDIVECIIENDENRVNVALMELATITLETRECKTFIETLLLRGIKQDTLNMCLKLACRANNLMIVKLLVQHGANSFNPCLIFACWKRFTHIIQFLLDCDGASNYQDVFFNVVTNFFKSDNMNKDIDVSIAIMLLQKIKNQRVTCSDRKLLFRLLERGIDIEKFSSTCLTRLVKEKIQFFHCLIQNCVSQTIPRDLFDMISEYSLF